MDVTVDGLCKAFQHTNVLQDISFDVNSGELVSIIGPSGAGKTTLLKLLAGLEEPDDGDIRYAAPISIQHPAILVFQDYSLFPSMTVTDNIAFGLKARKKPREEIRQRVTTFLRHFNIADKAHVYPSQLSAGQQQRVAIARALIVTPAILLLDEPFANLDKNLKAETAEFIRATQKEYGITTVCVTHDLDEAFLMSDCIGILSHGRLIEYGTVEDVYYHPRSLQGAEFIGPVNRIPESLYSLLKIESDSDTVYARAEALEMRAAKDGVGTVEKIRFTGKYILNTVRIDRHELSVITLGNGLRQGDTVSVYVHDFFVPQEQLDPGPIGESSEARSWR